MRRRRSARHDGQVTDIDFPFATHLTDPPACPNSPGFEGVTNQLLLDCNHDDYFSMSPAPGGCLASCWNTAKSNFLVTSGVTPTTPDPERLTASCPSRLGRRAGSRARRRRAPPKKKCKKKRKRSAAAAKKCKKKKRNK